MNKIERLHVMAMNPRQLEATKFGKTGTTVDFSYVTNNNYDDMLLSSCSLTFQNDLYVFGGAKSFVNQVSKLINYRFVVIGRLKFQFLLGACATAGNDYIYLCFHLGTKEEMRLCRYAPRPDGTFSPIEKSNHRHGRISIAASKCKLTRLRGLHLTTHSTYL